MGNASICALRAAKSSVLQSSIGGALVAEVVHPYLAEIRGVLGALMRLPK